MTYCTALDFETAFGNGSQLASFRGELIGIQFDWAPVSPQVQAASVLAHSLGSRIDGAMGPVCEDFGHGSARVTFTPTITVTGGDPDTVALTLAGFRRGRGVWIWRAR